MYILDCTLRDGGYYNDWNFEPEIVKHYLSAVAISGVKYVELGFRSFPKKGFLGPFAYTKESYLRAINLPKGVTYGVMVDSKTILSSNYPTRIAVDKLFCSADESCIGLVRIASHFYEVNKSKDIAKHLKEKGYIVGFNLMQAAGRTAEELQEKAREISTWGTVDVLYFADSLGNMDSSEVVRVIDSIKTEWKGDIGIHTHDNMGRALNNCLAALSNGAIWLDATITGMGRGAGNIQTEYLMSVLMADYPELNPAPIYELVIRHFESMKKEYEWGGNLLYFLGAQYDVHPTYIQNLLSDPHIGKEEVVGALDFLLKQSGTNKYDGSVLEEALSLNCSKVEVSGQDVTGLFKGREVLILTNADSVKKHIKGIKLYIKQYKPVVISLNLNKILDDTLVDYISISHNIKFLSEKENYKEVVSSFILPMHRFSENELVGLSKNSNVDYGVEVVKGHFSVGNNSCQIPSELTLAYVLALCIAADVNSIKLVGFDGYPSNDSRQLEMLELLSLVKGEMKKGMTMQSMTPTSYPIEESSVYAYI